MIKPIRKLFFVKVFGDCVYLCEWKRVQDISYEGVPLVDFGEEEDELDEFGDQVLIDTDLELGGEQGRDHQDVLELSLCLM